jgi:hypothetical protein
MALAVLACLSIASAAGLTGGLVSCSPPASGGAARPLSAEEAQRLASMRLANYRDGRVGLRATLGSSGAETFLGGWVDWKRALVYVAVSGPGARAQRGLLQAKPGVLAMRPQSAAPGGALPTTATGLPPPHPPADGWRVRRFTTATTTPGPLDSLIALLFAVARDRADTAESLERSAARWLGRDRAGGKTVDVLLGPALPPPATASRAATPSQLTQPAHSAPTATPTGGQSSETSLAAMGGAVRYWLDSGARMHRFEALLPGGQPVLVDLDRSDQAELEAIDALGGDPVAPRAITGAEATLLSGVRQRNRQQRGAEIRVALPTAPAANLRARGWVDWRSGIAYLAVCDIDRPGRVTLMRAGRAGVASRPAPPATAAEAKPDAPPPLPPPRERAWTYRDWTEQDARLDGRDLDLLINEILSLAANSRDDAAALRASATWLRADTLGGTDVAVFEIPRATEAGGQTRLRYWVDAAGVLRRLELRTVVGAFAQLDLQPGDVPSVRTVPIRKPG